MVCLQLDEESLCESCRRELRPGSPRIVGGLSIRPALRHEGAVRRLIHDLKYRAVRPVAGLLAHEVVRVLPPGIDMIVPVPRVLARRLRYGVDQAGELASAVRRLTGLPVVQALAAPAWQPGHAGRRRADRRAVRFRAIRPVSRAVLVDDVVTTGATLAAAASTIGSGVLGAVTASGASV